MGRVSHSLEPPNVSGASAEQRQGDRRSPQPEKWHLKKEITVGFVFGFALLAFSGVQAFYKHEREIDLLKASVNANFTILANANAAQDRSFKDALSQLREQYTSLNAKIDRLIESAPKK